MSSFEVSDQHIDRLVYLRIHGPSDAPAPRYPGDARWRPWDGNASAVGQMLRDTNTESMRALYRDKVFLSGAYHYDPPTGSIRIGSLEDWRMTIAEAFNAIACYEYQASEFPGWLGSTAYHWCAELRRDVAGLVAADEGRSWDQWHKAPALVGSAS